MRLNYKAWTDDEVATAAEMWRRYYTPFHGAQKAVCYRIATELGRSASSVLTRYQDRGPSFSERSMYHKKADPAEVGDVHADRQLRDAARDRMNLTATFFGDPPPGYSALDKMRGENP